MMQDWNSNFIWSSLLLVFVHKEYWWMSGRQWRGMQRSRDNLLYSLLTDSTSKIPNLFTSTKQTKTDQKPERGRRQSFTLGTIFHFALSCSIGLNKIAHNILSNVTLILPRLCSIVMSTIAHKIFSMVTLSLPRLCSIGVSEQDNTLQPSQPTNIHHYWDCVPECFY